MFSKTKNININLWFNKKLFLFLVFTNIFSKNNFSHLHSIQAHVRNTHPLYTTFCYMQKIKNSSYPCNCTKNYTGLLSSNCNSKKSYISQSSYQLITALQHMSKINSAYVKIWVNTRIKSRKFLWKNQLNKGAFGTKSVQTQ